MTATASARARNSEIPPFTKRDFDTICDIVRARAGIVLGAGKGSFVQTRLMRLVREAGVDTFSAYVDRVQQDADERDRMVEALTTNHTKFFREDHHFDHFRAEVRPGLIRRAAARETVRLWSAGSSSGEEVFSLAMTLLGTEPSDARTILGGDVALLATDIAAHVLQLGRSGLYPASAADAIPVPLRERWTTAEGRDLAMAEPLRRLIRFRQLNLLDEWPISGRFDSIFCRNTMIYFDTPTREALQTRLVDVLKPGGFLYIGHSERLSGRAADAMQLVGPTIYKKGA